MRVQIVQNVLERSNIIVIPLRVDIVIHSNVADISFFEIDIDVVTRFDIVSAQSAEVLGDNRIDLSRLHIFQQFLKSWPLEVESGEPVIHIEIKNAEPVLLAELAQHHLLCLYAYTFTDLFIIFAQATINCCSF